MAHDDGYVPRDIPHFRFALILCMGKFLDSFSTVFVLQYSTDVSESVWLTRTLMEATSPQIGALITTILSVTALTLLAISVDTGSQYLPAGPARDIFASAGPILIYLGGCFFYVYLAIQNILLLI